MGLNYRGNDKKQSSRFLNRELSMLLSTQELLPQYAVCKVQTGDQVAGVRVLCQEMYGIS
jgi:hypothetical protein